MYSPTRGTLERWLGNCCVEIEKDIVNSWECNILYRVENHDESHAAVWCDTTPERNLPLHHTSWVIPSSSSSASPLPARSHYLRITLLSVTRNYSYYNFMKRGYAVAWVLRRQKIYIAQFRPTHSVVIASTVVIHSCEDKKVQIVYVRRDDLLK